MTARLVLELEKAGPFKRAISAITPLTDGEFVLRRDGDEVVMGLVNAENVTLARAHLPVDVFDEFEIDEEQSSNRDTWGIAFKEDVADTLSSLRVSSSLRLELEDGEWSIESSKWDDETVEIPYAGIDNIRQTPDIPDLELPVEVTANAADLKRPARLTKKHSGGHMAWGVDDGTFYTRADGDTNAVMATPPADVSGSESLFSLFSTDYLYNWIYGIPGPASTDVTLWLGDEFPIQFEYPLYGTDEGWIEGMIAPRIMSEGNYPGGRTPSNYDPTPNPRASAKAQSHEFSRLFAAMSTTVSEAKVHWGDSGIRSTFVDPANVAMTVARARPSFFDEYEAGPSFDPMGVNTDQLASVFDTIKKGTPTHFEYDPSVHYYRIEADWLQFSQATIDPDSIRAEPDIPAIPFSGRFSADYDDWYDGIALADDGGAVLLGTASGTGFAAYEYDDEDDDTQQHIETFDDAEGASLSLIDSGYLNDYDYKHHPETDIDVWLGVEYPALLTYEADGLEIANTIAPRVSNDGETHLEKSGVSGALDDAGVDMRTLSNIDGDDGVDPDTIATLHDVVDLPDDPLDAEPDEETADEDDEDDGDDGLGPYGLADDRGEGWGVEDVKAIAPTDVSDDTAKFLAYNFRSPGDLLKSIDNLERTGEDLEYLPGVGEARAREMSAYAAGIEDQFTSAHHWDGLPDRYTDDDPVPDEEPETGDEWNEQRDEIEMDLATRYGLTRDVAKRLLNEFSTGKGETQTERWENALERIAKAADYGKERDRLADVKGIGPATMKKIRDDPPIDVDDESDEDAAEDDVVVPKKIGAFQRHDTPPGRLRWVRQTGEHIAVEARQEADEWEVHVAREDGESRFVGAGSKQDAVDEAVNWMQGWEGSTTALEDDPMEADDVTDLARMFEPDVNASTWQTPVSDLPGIGPKMAEKLKGIGISSAEGLTYWWLTYGSHLIRDVEGMTTRKAHRATKGFEIPPEAVGLDSRGELWTLRAIRVFGIDNEFVKSTSRMPDKQAIIMAEEGPGNQFSPPSAYEWDRMRNSDLLPKQGSIAFGPDVTDQLHARESAGDWEGVTEVVPIDDDGYDLWLYIHPSGSYTVLDSQYLDDVSTWFGGADPDAIPAEANERSGEAVIFMPESPRNVAVGPHTVAHKDRESVPGYVLKNWPGDAPDPVPEAEYTPDSYEEFAERMDDRRDDESDDDDGVYPLAARDALEIPENPGDYELAEVEEDDRGVQRIEWTGEGGSPPAHLERPAEVSVQAISHGGSHGEKWSADVRHMDDDHQPPLSALETRRLQTYFRRDPAENAQDAIDRAVEWMQEHPNLGARAQKHTPGSFEAAKHLRGFLQDEYGLGNVKIGAFQRLGHEFGPDVREIAEGIRSGEADPTEIKGIGSVTADHLETWADDTAAVAYVWAESGQMDRPVEINDSEIIDKDGHRWLPKEGTEARDREPWVVEPDDDGDDLLLERAGRTAASATVNERATEADDAPSQGVEDSGTSDDARTASAATASDSDNDDNSDTMSYNESDLNQLVNAGVHKGRARKILREYGTIDKAQNAGVEGMADIHGVGETTAERVMGVNGGGASNNTDYESRTEDLRAQVESGTWASDPTAVDRQATDAEREQIPGPVRGAMSQMFRAYKGQVDTAEKYRSAAQQYKVARETAVGYATLINEVRDEYGQPPLVFEELEDNTMPPLRGKIDTETPGAPTNDSLGTSITPETRSAGAASSGTEVVADGPQQSGPPDAGIFGVESVLNARPDRPGHWSGEYGITADGQPYDPGTGRRLPDADWVYSEGTQVASKGGATDGGDTYDAVADNADAEANGGYTEQESVSEAQWEQAYRDKVEGERRQVSSARSARYGGGSAYEQREEPEGVDESEWEEAYTSAREERLAPERTEFERGVPISPDTEGVIDEDVGSDDDQQDFSDYGIGETGGDRADAYEEHYSRENQLSDATEGFGDALERNLTDDSSDEQPAGRSLSHPDRPDNVDDMLDF